MNGFGLWQKRVFTIVSLEWKKTLFSRRGLWVYALAFLPALLFGINSIRVKNQRANVDRIAISAPNSAAASAAIKTGMPINDAAAILLNAKIIYQRSSRGRNGEIINYMDANASWVLVFRNGELTDKRRSSEAHDEKAFENPKHEV